MKKGRSLLIEDLIGGAEPHGQPSELGRALEYAVNVGRAPLPEGVRVKRPFGWSEVDAALVQGRWRVRDIAMGIFGDEEKADRWLTTPKDQFNGKSPLEMFGTLQEVQQVEQALIALQEGYF